MMELSKELQKRLTSVDTRGSKVTLKLKKQKEGAKEPPKFLGHGSCHNLSKSVELPTVSCDAETIYKSGMSLLKMMPINSVHEVRGMG
jgi:DNA repair protein REV1